MYFCGCGHLWFVPSFEVETLIRRRANESLDASGGSVFSNLIRPAMLIEFAPPRQLHRYAATFKLNRDL